MHLPIFHFQNNTAHFLFAAFFLLIFSLANRTIGPVMTLAYIYIIVRGASLPALPPAPVSPPLLLLLILPLLTVSFLLYLWHTETRILPVLSPFLSPSHRFTMKSEPCFKENVQYFIIPGHVPFHLLPSRPLYSSQDQILSHSSCFFFNIIFYYFFENSSCTCDEFWSYLILTPSPNPTEIHPFRLPLPNFMSFF